MERVKNQKKIKGTGVIAEKRLDFFSGLCVDRPSREAKRGYFLPKRIPLFFAPP
jgi:hypothetical protein